MQRAYTPKYNKYPKKAPPKQPKKRRSRFDISYSRSLPRPSNVNHTNVNTLTVGKVGNVKLTYTKEWSSTITPASDQWGTVAYSTGTRTYPIAGEVASILFLGSQFCTPLGSANNTTVTIKEDYPSGLVDWATFYDEAICYGSSIHVQIAAAVGTQAGLCRYILIPYVGNSSDADNTNISVAGTTRNQLDALDYGDLSSYPGAQSGYINNAAVGITNVKAFRKTSTMLGIKDVNDNQAELAMLLPKQASLNTGSNSPGAQTESKCWLWYLRIFNLDNLGTSNAFYFTVRIKYYTQLMTRGIILQETANA